MSNAAESLRHLVRNSGISSVAVVAWRDLDDPEAGGSELHADEILSRWAEAGLMVTSRTSAVPGRATEVTRHGYRVSRRGGRYQVFPSVFWSGLLGRKKSDALVEIWNGMPFFSPLWFRGRRLVLLHHVHGAMWQMTLPGILGRIGWFIEHRLAPLFYRRTSISTLSNSSKAEISDHLGLNRVAVVPPGISPFFEPGLVRSEVPLVVAVGRLVPVKRFDSLIKEFVKIRASVPNAIFAIVGEGYLRTELESLIAENGAQEWISLPGRVTDEELRDIYQRAWLVTSASLREGWGMSLTEAAACGTPSVAVDIAGHRDAVRDGVSGILVPEELLGTTICSVLTDEARLAELRDGALNYANSLTWDAAALRLFELLANSN